MGDELSLGMLYFKLEKQKSIENFYWKMKAKEVVKRKYFKSKNVSYRKLYSEISPRGGISYVSSP